MKKEKITLEELKKEIAQFIKERDWKQFHTPKDLSMAMAVEAGELMEKFLWLKPKESIKLMKNKREFKEIEKEIADIMIHAIDFCNTYGISLEQAIQKKLKYNAKKYPIPLAKGRVDKYTSYRKPNNKNNKDNL